MITINAKKNEALSISANKIDIRKHTFYFFFSTHDFLQVNM